MELSFEDIRGNDIMIDSFVLSRLKKEVKIEFVFPNLEQQRIINPANGVYAYDLRARIFIKDVRYNSLDNNNNNYMQSVLIFTFIDE